MDTLYDCILEGKGKISVIGLGYVGLPIAVSFAKRVKVIGFDINEEKIKLYRKGIDPSHETNGIDFSKITVDFTSNPLKLNEAKFHIVAVPTPIHADHVPDLSSIREATRILGQNLSRNSIIVYESTVYPGITEEICIPILERESGLCCGKDFKVGYSPERINPGDRLHRLENIVKIVSGMDEETTDIIAKMYELVVTAGTYKTPTIKVAEAAKVIENCQRDINIAFMNEISMIFHRMGIDTQEVLMAAKTKWNFLDFQPGLVGGHCIGVDPYYLTYKAKSMGYYSQIISSGRRINDGMGKFIGENLVKKLIHWNVSVKNARIAIFGITFKENCPDVRNTKVMDIYHELLEYGIEAMVVDPVADPHAVRKLYGIELKNVCDVMNMDAVVISVGHQNFKKYNVSTIRNFYKSSQNTKVFFDVRGIFDRNNFTFPEFDYWRL